MTTLTTTLILQAANNGEHTKNKAFIAQRLPIGNTWNATYIVDDVAKTITVTYTYNWSIPI